MAKNKNPDEAVNNAEAAKNLKRSNGIRARLRDVGKNAADRGQDLPGGIFNHGGKHSGGNKS